MVRWITYLVFADEGNLLWRQRVFRAAVCVATTTVLAVGQASVRQSFWRWVFRIALFYAGIVAMMALCLAADTDRYSTDADSLLFFALRWNSMLLGMVMFFRLVYELQSAPRPHDWLHRLALVAFIIAGCNAAVAYFVLPRL
jgi:hypothetical protein